MLVCEEGRESWSQMEGIACEESPECGKYMGCATLDEWSGPAEVPKIGNLFLQTL